MGSLKSIPLLLNTYNNNIMRWTSQQYEKKKTKMDYARKRVKKKERRRENEEKTEFWLQVNVYFFSFFIYYISEHSVQSESIDFASHLVNLINGQISRRFMERKRNTISAYFWACVPSVPPPPWW